MSLMAYILGKVTAAFAKVTGEAIKSGAEIAKTATEIPKNLIETEKAHLEVRALKDERELKERLLVPATFDEVKEFDPKYRLITRNMSCFDHDPAPDYRKAGRGRVLLSGIIAFLVAGAGALSYHVFLSSNSSSGPIASQHIDSSNLPVLLNLWRACLLVLFAFSFAVFFSGFISLLKKLLRSLRGSRSHIHPEEEDDVGPV